MTSFISNSLIQKSVVISVILFFAIVFIMIYKYAAFNLPENVDLSIQGSSIFDMDVHRVVEDFTSFHGHRSYKHPLYVILIAPLGKTINKVVYDGKHAIFAAKWIILTSITIYSLLVGLLIRQITGLWSGSISGAVFCGVSFSAILFASIPESASVSGLATLVPLVYLYRRWNKPFSFWEAFLWGTIAVICIGITITQIVHWFISLAIRIINCILLINNNISAKKCFLDLAKLVLTFSVAIVLICSLSYFQNQLNPHSWKIYHWSEFNNQKGDMRLTDFWENPAFHVWRLSKHFLLYNFISPYPTLSDYLIKTHHLPYYALSLEEQDYDGYKWIHIPGLVLVVFMLLYSLRIWSWNHYYFPLLLSLASQLGLHLLYGREYILYSMNWHGVVIVLIFSSIFLGARMKKQWLAVGICVGSSFILAANLSVMEHIYYDFLFNMEGNAQEAVKIERQAGKPYQMEWKASVMGLNPGSIIDGNIYTLAVTWNNKMQEEAWFEISYNPRQKAQKVVFIHGRNFFGGGWFDTSKKKPEIWIADFVQSRLEKVGELRNYPQTGFQKPIDIVDYQRIEEVLDQQYSIARLRIVGKPACGKQGTQSFASCSELFVESLGRAR